MLVVRRSYGIQADQAVQLAYRTLGFSRTTEGMKKHLRKIMAAMLEKNKLKLNNNELTIK